MGAGGQVKQEVALPVSQCLDFPVIGIGEFNRPQLVKQDFPVDRDAAGGIQSPDKILLILECDFIVAVLRHLDGPFRPLAAVCPAAAAERIAADNRGARRLGSRTAPVIGGGEHGGGILIRALRLVILRISDRLGGSGRGIHVSGILRITDRLLLLIQGQLRHRRAFPHAGQTDHVFPFFKVKQVRRVVQPFLIPERLLVVARDLHLIRHNIVADGIHRKGFVRFEVIPPDPAESDIARLGEGPGAV